jgi:hypothetical protein
LVDGKSALRGLRELLNERSTSSWLDTRSSYYWIYQSAIEFVRRTQCLKNTQSITTVADQASYTLNADFMEMYLRTEDTHELYIKYNDGTSDYFIKFKKYQEIIYENQTTSKTIPDFFTIIDDSVKDTRLSSTTTSVGAASGGECTLTDSAADFADVSPGDIVHNTTDGSDGVVLSKTSSTALVTALFDGTDNDWTSGDAYVIQPQARLKIVFDPAPSTSSHTATVYYIERPDPVYSDYGIYRIQSQYLQALVFYAAALYEYRDDEVNSSSRLVQFFDREVRQASAGLNDSFERKGFTTNWKKRT